MFWSSWLARGIAVEHEQGGAFAAGVEQWKWFKLGNVVFAEMHLQIQEGFEGGVQQILLQFLEQPWCSILGLDSHDKTVMQNWGTNKDIRTPRCFSVIAVGPVGYFPLR